MIIWRMIDGECKGHLELSGANFLTINWYLIQWLFEEWLMKNVKGTLSLWEEYWDAWDCKEEH